MTDSTTDTTSTPAGSNEAEGILWAILSYLGIFALIPLLVKKENPLLQFHSKQGLALFIIQVIVSVIFGVLGATIAGILATIGSLISLVIFVVAIIGMVKCFKGEYWELPVIGPKVRSVNVPG